MPLDKNKLRLRSENADFLQYAYKRLWLAVGGCEEEAERVARGISLGDRMRKFAQGTGVFEALLCPLESGNVNLTGRPEIVSEGTVWTLYDANKVTGYWAFSLAMEKAVEKAREHAIAISLVRNSGDGGAFYHYTSIALEADMVGIASNNTPPFLAPWGGASLKMGCPPWSIVIPAGERKPIVIDTMLGDVHDGLISEAAMSGEKLPGKFLVDPDTGELTDDPAPYIKAFEGYGRVCDNSAVGVFGTPRMYALNIMAEIMTGLIIPGAITSDQVPPPTDWLEKKNEEPLIPGAFFLAIDPSHFGPLDGLKAKVDTYIDSLKSAKKMPGVEEIFLPGERALRLQEESKEVEVMQTHWSAFLGFLDKYDLDIEELRREWGG